MGVVDQVRTVAATLAGVQEPKTDADRAEALRRLALDEELVNALKDPLLQLGYTLDTTDLLDPADDSHTVSVAYTKRAKLFIVSLPFWVLSDPQLANIGAFGIVENLFPEDSVVYIVSRDLENMATAFSTIMAKWKYRGIAAYFIPWSKAAKFLAEKNKATALQRVKHMFDLEGHAPAAPGPPAGGPVPLNDSQKKQVVGVIVVSAGEPIWPTPQDYLQYLVQTANIPNAASFKGAWKGNADADALTLVDYANKKQYPFNHDWAGQNMLGRILNAVLEQGLSPDDATMIANLVLDHSLISDPPIVSAIRIRYAAAQGGVV
jgi:hypothetical protein